MKRSILASLISLAGASVLLGGGSALAATNSFIVDLNKSFGEGYTGVTATMDFLFGDAGDSNANTYTLDLTIKNTSSAPIINSSLVGFAFDTPTGVSSLVFNPFTSRFIQASDTSIPPAPSFNFCATTVNDKGPDKVNKKNGSGQDNCVSGSTDMGLTMAPDNNQATVKFTFDYKVAGLAPTVGDVSTAFFNLFNGLQVPPPPNEDTADKDTVVLAARFQAINSATETGGSDKITGKPRNKPGGGPGDAVPGPLPVLGAAAAFVQTRRLRRRLAAARSTQPNPG